MRTAVRTRAAVIALAAALIVGLGAMWGWNAAPTGASSDPETATIAAGTTTAVTQHPSRGCGAAPKITPGSTASLSLPSGGRDRTYLVHVPSEYRQDHALPLVLAFHGRGQSGQIMQAQSGLSNLPAIVAYPEGVVSQPIDKRAWQGAPYAADGVDDMAFTQALVDSLQGSLCVDLDRVYAVGHSNGGGFAVAVGCELSEEFAAVAAVSAALYGETVACEHPMSIFELHGTDDSIIAYVGADEPGLQLPNVAAWVRAQAAVNGCRAEPSDRLLGMFVTRFVFSQCDSDRKVVHLRVTGGGHGWRDELIGGRPLFAHIWNFLLSQPRVTHRASGVTHRRDT